MRFISLLFAALAAAAVLVTGSGQTVRVIEEERVKLINEDPDVTESEALSIRSLRLATAPPYPTEIKQQARVEGLLKKIEINRVESHLVQFSSFFNRYYNTQHGVHAAEWVHAQIEKALRASTAEGASKPSVRYVKHDWIQPSLIVTIPGINPDKKVVLCSHIDSINSTGTVDNMGRAPGADDNGSGSMNNLEVLRIVLSDPEIAAGKHLTTLEWHFYSAEEVGLLGSEQIWSQYSNQDEDVIAVLNQDMVGYIGRDGVERFGLTMDNVSIEQNEYIKLIMAAYTDIPYEETSCNFVCSDHISANKYGYRASYIFETTHGNHSPYIHSINDTVEHVDFDHVIQYTKLSTGFMVELAHHDFSD